MYVAKILRGKYVNMARLNMKKSADVPLFHKEALCAFSGPLVDAIFDEYATCTEKMTDEEAVEWHNLGSDVSTEIVEAYILEAYRRQLDTNAGDNTVEKCAEKFAILLPVRFHTAEYCPIYFAPVAKEYSANVSRRQYVECTCLRMCCTS